MILFHVPRIDSGDLRQWLRTIEPACLMRRAGVATRIAIGGLHASDLPGVSSIVIGGASDVQSAELAARARAAGARVILDIADTRSLSSGAKAAQSADLIVASNHRLATLAAAGFGTPSALRVIPDSAIEAVGLREALRAFPLPCLKVMADAARLRIVDAVRRIRHRIRKGPRTAAAEGIRIVWFGDGTRLNQEGGLGELLLAAGDLVDLSQEIPYRLRVIGGSRRMFRRTFGRMPIDTEFRRLTIPTLARDLRGADLCFLPGGGDAMSRARSAARAEIARALGIPVLTVPHGDLSASPRLTMASDWSAALRSIVAGKIVRDGGSTGADPGAISAMWRSALAEDAKSGSVGDGQPVGRPRRLRALFLLQQFQDLDLICPVAEAATAEMEVNVAILTKIAIPATRRLRLLRERGAKLEFWRAKDLAAGRIRIAPGDFDVAMTASDGPGGGARHAATFVRAANEAGAATLNLQHGLDNSGLTFGPPPAAGATPFVARLVLTWGGFDRLTHAADPATRAKVVPVGCPKSVLGQEGAADFPLAGRRFIAVFENLHWRRYSDEYRRRFVQDLIDAAAAAPDLIFVLKPHMGGRWFTRTNAERAVPNNLVVADPGAPTWRRFSADSFLAHASGAITTPSTIALDAARYGLPTAVVAYGIAAENYAPLFRIEAAADWAAFLGQVRAGDHDMTRVRTFRDAAIVPGDAVTRVLAVMRLACAGRSQAEILADLAREGGAVST